MYHCAVCEQVSLRIKADDEGPDQTGRFADLSRPSQQCPHMLYRAFPSDMA